MPSTHKGSCLCGRVQFEISGEFAHFYLCHCDRCRKDTGSAHAANLFTEDFTIDWLQGQSQIRSYRLPQSMHAKSFCTECGSALPQLQMDGRLLMVPAGSLDSELHRRPDAHLFSSERAAWDRALDSLPSCEGLPE